MREHYRLAKTTPIKFGTRLEIFGILLSLHLKSILYRKNKPFVTQQIFQYKVTGFNYYSILFLFKEIIVSDQYHFKASTSKPNIIDCGANIGMSIIYFKLLYPDSSIIGFEPNPYAFEILKKNVVDNSLSNVRIENIGLASDEGKLAFYLGEFKGSLMGSIIAGRGGENVLEIQTRKLSQFLEGSHFDMIKIDIEGAENEVLRDLEESGTLAAGERYIIEYHHRINSNRSNLSAFLIPFEKSGFEYTVTNTYTQGNFQDLLLSFYKE
jgi:FkbM family methyltransferase